MKPTIQTVATDDDREFVVVFVIFVAIVVVVVITYTFTSHSFIICFRIDRPF